SSVSGACALLSPAHAPFSAPALQTAVLGRDSGRFTAAAMNLRSIRQALFGNDRDVYDPHLFHRITVGAIAAWIAMGGDLLGSCVYGPDVLARQSGNFRSVLLVSGAATLVTLAILAVAYTR